MPDQQKTMIRSLLKEEQSKKYKYFILYQKIKYFAKNPKVFYFQSGEYRSRTDDLLHAMQAL